MDKVYIAAASKKELNERLTAKADDLDCQRLRLYPTGTVVSIYSPKPRGHKGLSRASFQRAMVTPKTYIWNAEKGRVI